MLQSTEYDRTSYVRWLRQVHSFSAVMNRRALDRTNVARAFMAFVAVGILVQVTLALAFVAFGVTNESVIMLIIGGIVLVSSTTVWAYMVVIPLFFAKRFVIDRKHHMFQAETKRILGNHKGTKIAVAGSFGKTTMKELLATVLAEGKRVAYTPGNKNVATAHYDFARTLSGDEDIIIVEFGEGSPGDVARFTRTVHPDVAVITGIAPAHLDQYASVHEAATDIFSLASQVKPSNVYVNIESKYVSEFIKSDYVGFDGTGLDGWSVSDVVVDLSGTTFKLRKGKTRLTIKSGLIGRHLIGVLSATAVIAKHVGLSDEQIESGFIKTIPYEHRMQPYRIGGAWVIDDSYNGNLQGIKAGTELLGSLSATRKIYVTPGLVDQGSDSAAIHQTIGRLIAAANPDIVVLMHNSVTKDIISGLGSAGYSNELSVQEDPLLFYKNLDHFVAKGDVVLLQNDWTDNYR